VRFILTDSKRVDFSARSVITSDPYINIDEVGVPKNIAMELTIPEEVTPYNIKNLTELVQNGRDIYPGANFVFRTIYKDGKSDIQKIDLKYRKKSIKLNIGDVVERHSVNGDYVLFNRQPTLHKPSMMGHKMHVLDRDDVFTMRMNVSVTGPYNADFDGDEMNIHIAQSVQARNELNRIANVKYQIIGAKDSNPIIGCVQDALAGLYLLTKLDTKIKGSEVSNFLCNTSSDTKNEIDLNKIYNGREIFSHIIPKGINNTVIKNDKKVLEIVDGELKIGILDKATLSKVKNSIIHFIWDKYGPDKTRRFIDDSQRLALSYLNYHGFTFGIKDCMTDVKTDNQIKEMINNKILEYNTNLTQYENDTDQINSMIIETNLSSDLNAFSSEIGNILMKNLGPYNNLFVCIDSKSKGNLMNMQHIMGCVGQKSVEGTRIKKKIENRTLPIFHKDDDSPEARGFIMSSYFDGINSYEFFYDAMAGREGLIDTAIKSVTWETLILIIDNNEPKYIEIGKWIDNLLELNKENIKHFNEKQMELLDTKNIYIPTMDYKGIVSWGEISAITRHDPTEKLYEIKTFGKRDVIVTDSKSLLIFNNNTNEFKEMLSSEIKVGDYVPVTGKLCDPPVIINTFDNKVLDYNYGLLLGKELNDIPNYIMLAPNEFINGFLETYKKNNSLNKLRILKARKSIFDDNFKKLNDVILDKIVEINLVNPINHPKVYDLTIPSTFNFGLANGLQVRDTAKTGYVQRQLIKGLEDLVIKYDNTNRNAKNVIIQYVYGENGVDQSRQIELNIELISLNNDELELTYSFTKEEIRKLNKEHKIKDLEKFNKLYLKRIKEYRDKLRKIQMISNNNYKTLEEKYMLPVNLFRLTQDYSKNKVNMELNPEEILDALEELLNSAETRLLPGLKDSDKYLLKDDRSLKYLFEISIHDYLCPKKCIFKYGLSKKEFKLILDEIKLNYIKSLVQPGEMVGIITAQSIGEPTSQITLNTKHSAGVASKNTNTTGGVQRIEELLHYSKDIKTPQMTIYFDKEILNDRSKVNKISSYLTHLTIKELISNAQIYYDTGSDILKNDQVSNPFFINNQRIELTSLPFVFRIKLNMEKMHDKETTLLDIKTKFISHWTKYFINMKNMKKNEKDIFTKISRCAILSNNNIENQIIHIRFNMSSFNYNLLTDFLKIVLEQITLKGIDNITSSDLVQERKLSFNPENGNMDIGKEYVVYTTGINIEKLKYIKGINHTLTTCNDISTIFRLYGIEAARQILINEFMSTFNSGGSKAVNHSHMSVLIDMMTHMGNIISIDRHGLDKVDSEPIARASFEKTMDHFLNAALFNQKDNLQSVSSRIMMGRVIPGGTGAFELLLDTDKLENSEYSKDEQGGRISFPYLEPEKLFQDIITYGFSKNDFFLPI
jgi:DNA-directed RNA polymerase beta' subunit